jgi:serine/threonine protein kinase/formylglycine-generating enzyme required for sulfatase activity
MVSTLETSVHPTMKQIESLVTGLLDEAQAASVQEHIDRCQSCQALREECRQNQAFAEELKSAVKAEPLRDAAVPLDAGEKPVAAGSPVIEGYEVGELLGEGGQGIVYRAVQQFPRREVVIKLLKGTPGSASAAAKRFEREIMIAARLRHPGIVTVHDSGVLPDGRRFCVMEYVHGLPLTQYVKERGLSLGETLELFARVCDAVSYAHQRGIMHRDLKPSNILVDADGQPKVVDFGLARAVGQIDDMHVSRSGQVVGAPAYMSPEQTRGNPDEIDVRTDVYSLGVILYELLTGVFPYDVESDLHSLITRIREQVPTPPTSAWKTDSGIRSARRIRWLWRERLPRCPIDRELETIVLVCLRKERDRRYQSAGELARDIRRYLAGEPIDAKRDSLPYVLRKWLWRRRKPIATALLVGSVVIAAMVWSVWYRAHQQAKLDRAAASEILAGFMHDLPEAIGRLDASNSAVKAQVREQSRANVASTSFADRMTGARSAFLLDPDAFWQSVNGGPLSTGGEWLEVCRAEWPDRAKVVRQLAERARTGTDRQKYVAFCLLGQIARREDQLAETCVEAARSETHPGVVTAARWAAARLGNNVEHTARVDVLPDKVLGTTFVRVPGSDDFRQGSPDNEADRHTNEGRPAVGQRVEPFFMSISEVTVAAFAGFVGDPAYMEQSSSRPAGDMSDIAREAHKAMLGLSPAEQKTTPVSHVSLNLARKYCEWLNRRAKTATPTRRYRLPTEPEWEWACRGGNDGRFCFGSNADYLKYFADCNGDERSHTVAQRMPNWYGLFDMHGGLWEWTSSKYEPAESELIEFPEWKGRTLFAKRGGAFYSPAVRCRSAQRNCAEAQSVDFYTGLRLVVEMGQP